jgi:hypothetical protein
MASGLAHSGVRYSSFPERRNGAVVRQCRIGVRQHFNARIPRQNGHDAACHFVSLVHLMEVVKSRFKLDAQGLLLICGTGIFY